MCEKTFDSNRIDKYLSVFCFYIVLHSISLFKNFIAVACLVVFFVLLYVLMFYVFHKWIKQDNKAIKVFVCGHKHGKARLLTKSLKVMYRFDEEVFNTKEEALK